MKPIILSRELAQNQFKLYRYDPLGIVGFNNYILLDGYVEIDTDLEEGTFETLFFSDKESPKGNTLFLINGNLSVKGDINFLEGKTCLFVLGDVRCDVLHSFDNIIHVKGDAYIKYAFNGNYNHGSITIEGVTHVPYILNSDHDSRLNPSEETIKINYYGSGDDFFTYNFYRKDLERITDNSKFNIYNSEKDEFSYEQFIHCLKSGATPILPGIKSSQDLLEDEIHKLVLTKPTTTTLDLSGKKLKELPKSLFKIERLQELNLQKNNLIGLPKDIGELKNLRVLDLSSTNIEQLPKEIGDLENLEVLNLSYCQNLKSLPESIGRLTNLKKLMLQCYPGEVPKSITDLDSLEYLDLYGWYLYDPKPADFPDWVCKLKSLKILKLGNNSFSNLPKEILELKNLEYLDLNAALSYVSIVPDLSQLTKLKELEASGSVMIDTRPHVQQEILQSYFKITSLERLRIDSYGKEEKFIYENMMQQMIDQTKGDPDKLEKLNGKLRKEEREFNGQKRINYYYTSRRAIRLDDFKGMDNLINLKYLNIAYNYLEKIPAEIFELKKLEHIVINGNDFKESELKRLKELNPNMVIE